MEKIIVGVGAIAILVIGIFVGFKACGKKQEVNITNVNLSTHTEKVEELVTLKYKYTDLINYEKEGKDFPLVDLKVPFTSDHYIIIYGGTISIGFKEMKVVVNDENKTCRIEIPQPEILAHTENDDVKDFISIKNSVFTHLDPAESINNFNEIIAENKREKEIQALEDEEVINDAIEKYKSFWTNRLKGYTIKFIEKSDDDKKEDSTNSKSGKEK